MNVSNTAEAVIVNIWDDFYADEHLPIGKIQETYGYIDDDVSIKNQKVYLAMILQYIKENLNTDDIKITLQLYDPKKAYPKLVGMGLEGLLTRQWRILLKGISHKRLDEWMKTLGNTQITINNLLFSIISES